jgi:A/G-specific adenine glycosylase
VRETFWLILMDEQRAVVLLKRRSPTGLWGGLYGFIECESEVQVAGEWARRSSVSGGIPEPLPALRHAFTHFEMHIHPYVGRLHELIAAEDQDEAWYNLRQPPALGIAAPVAKLLKNLSVRGGGRAVKPRGG